MDDCRICRFMNDWDVASTKHGVVTYGGLAIKEGHLVVASRRHVPSLSDLTDEEATGVLALLRKAVRGLGEIRAWEKIYVLMIGDKDTHFHAHVIPRLPGEAPVGPFVFGPEGWRSVLGPSSPDSRAVSSMREVLRSILK